MWNYLSKKSNNEEQNRFNRKKQIPDALILESVILLQECSKKNSSHLCFWCGDNRLYDVANQNSSFKVYKTEQEIVEFIESVVGRDASESKIRPDSTDDTLTDHILGFIYVFAPVSHQDLAPFLASNKFLEDVINNELTNLIQKKVITCTSKNRYLPYGQGEKRCYEAYEKVKDKINEYMDNDLNE